MSASNTSAIATILAERGISSPFSPSGYPEPSHFSWWYLAISSATLKKSLSNILRLSLISLNISAPTDGCVFISCHSSGVSGPGFLSIASGIDTFPISWEAALRSISNIYFSEISYPGIFWAFSPFAKITEYFTILCMCSPVDVSLPSTSSAKLDVILENTTFVKYALFIRVSISLIIPFPILKVSLLKNAFFLELKKTIPKTDPLTISGIIIFESMPSLLMSSSDGLYGLSSCSASKSSIIIGSPESIIFFSLVDSIDTSNPGPSLISPDLITPCSAMIFPPS